MVRVLYGSEGVHYFEMVSFLFNSVIYIPLLLCLCIIIVCLCIFIVMYVFTLFHCVLFVV